MNFKRGFLNSKKGRAALERRGDISEDCGSTPLSKSHESTLQATRGDASDRSRVHSRLPVLVSREITVLNASNDSDRREQEKQTGYKRVPLDLHMPPPGIGDPEGKRRIVFRNWPRGLHGKAIRHDRSYDHGKKTSNGWELWGETLYDFYHVSRIPNNTGLVTLSSGSRLADIMREFGELDAAASEIAWADSEGDPMQLAPYDIGGLITKCEETFGTAPDGSGSKDPCAYPSLQQRLPFHLLPDTLVVHDTGNSLNAKAREYPFDVSWLQYSPNHPRNRKAHDRENPWSASTKQETIHQYALSLSDVGKEKRKRDREKAEEDEKIRIQAEKDAVRVIFRELKGHGSDTLYAVHVKIPPRPPRPASVPEAHLYLRRHNHCGTGNHSVVYDAILELPRRVLVDDVLCPECLESAIDKELDRLQKSGCLHFDDKEESQPIFTEVSRVVNDRNNVCLVLPDPDGDRPHVPESSDEETNINLLGAKVGCIEVTPRVLKERQYAGPVVEVEPKVLWQNTEDGPLCEHLERNRSNSTSTTARVRVCAKLSNQHDDHLQREVESYQAFPDSFFEHWNGYNLVYPLHDPTPVGAIVPQFYGHYVPKRKSAKYLSPIMLVENCGKPIVVDELTDDERNDIAAKFFHFMNAGWAQNSIYDRNVLVQPGPLTASPENRSNKQHSFRIIDFGRAEKYDQKSLEFVATKDDVFEMLKHEMYVGSMPHRW